MVFCDIMAINKIEFFLGAVILQTTINIGYLFLKYLLCVFLVLSWTKINLALGLTSVFFTFFNVLILLVLSFVPACTMMQSGFWPTYVSISSSTVLLKPLEKLLTLTLWFLHKLFSFISLKREFPNSWIGRKSLFIGVTIIFFIKFHNTILFREFTWKRWNSIL